MKVILKHEIAQRQNAKDFLRELRMLAALQASSPFIIAIQHAFQDDDYLYMMMELCTGGDLAVRIGTSYLSGLGLVKGSIREAEARFRVRVTATHMKNDFPLMDNKTVRRVLMQLVMGISALHSRCILHRDLKPANVLINAQGNCVVADFSLAVYVPKDLMIHENHERRVVGTLGYIAPEILEGLPQTTKVDYWSLGAIVYRMVFKDLPWDLDMLRHIPNPQDAFQVVKQNIKDRPIANTLREPKCMKVEIDPSLRLLIQGLLTVEVSQRYGEEEVKKSAYFKGVDWTAVDFTSLSPFPPVPLYLKLLLHVTLLTMDDLRTKPLDSFDVPDLPKLDSEQQSLFQDWKYDNPNAHLMPNGVDLLVVHAQISKILKEKGFSGSLFLTKLRAPGTEKQFASLNDLQVGVAYWTAEGTCLFRVTEAKVNVGHQTLLLKKIKPLRPLKGAKRPKSSDIDPVSNSSNLTSPNLSPRSNAGLSPRSTSNADESGILKKGAQIPSWNSLPSTPITTEEIGVADASRTSKLAKDPSSKRSFKKATPTPIVSEPEQKPKLLSISEGKTRRKSHTIHLLPGGGFGVNSPPSLTPPVSPPHSDRSNYTRSHPLGKSLPPGSLGSSTVSMSSEEDRVALEELEKLYSDDDSPTDRALELNL